MKKRNIITLALYRQQGSLEKGNKYSYVETNPDKETILNEGDVALILAQNFPSENCNPHFFKKKPRTGGPPWRTSKKSSRARRK